MPARSWALPLVVSLWLWAAGWLPHWAEREGAAFPRWWITIGGVLLAGILHFRVRDAWEWGMHARWLSTCGYWLAWVSGAAAAAWLWLAAETTPWQQTPLLLMVSGLLGMIWYALMEWGAARALLTLGTPNQTVVGELEIMRKLLDRAGMAGIAVLDRRETRSGHAWLLAPRERDDEGEPLPQLADFADFTMGLPRLVVGIATHWRQRNPDFVFKDQDFRPEPIAVDRWWLHVTTNRDMERAAVPISSAPPPGSWKMPVWLGLFMDGDPMNIELFAKHVKIVGKNGGGKSVTASNIARAALVAQTGGRRECHVWMCATDKLVPLVWPWLRRYLSGQDDHPVLDWVAGEDPYEVLRMLAAAYRWARARNALNDDTSSANIGPDNPGLVIIWDEATHGGASNASIEIDGEDYTISRLVNTLLANSRSAGLSMVALTQQGVYDGLGHWGPDMMSNFTVRFCTATEKPADGFLTLPKLEGMGVDPTMMPRNMVYMQPSWAEDARVMPGKMGHLDGVETIEPVVAQVAALPEPRWTDDDLEAFGPDYAYRWDPRRLPSLARACQRREWAWRPQPPRDVPVPAAIGGSDTTDTDGGDDMFRKRERRTVDPIAMLPSDAEVDELEKIAARMHTEVLERERAEGLDPDRLPEPMESVEEALALLTEGGGVSWVATAQLCEHVWGTTDGKRVNQLGRAIHRHCPRLRATSARDYPGGRGRGYEVAELLDALARLRE